MLAKLSLRQRVLILFSLIMLGVMALGCTQLIWNARKAVNEEIKASEELARKLAITAITSLSRAGQTAAILSDLPVQLQHPRHVRISILNMHDDLVPGSPLPTDDETTDEAAVVPGWFQSLLHTPPKIIRIPVIAGGQRLGTVVITGEPYDEIAEIWQDFRVILILMVSAYIGLLLAFHWVIGQALQPLGAISKGLEALEARHYSTRLPRIQVCDLTQIGGRFNALAATLEATTREKDSLHRQLLTMQDTERKNIALELHDEFGPCLFGIKVDAASIRTASGRCQNGVAEALGERAASILSTVDHMQKLNRALLHRLRPMALGHVGLAELLEKLVEGFRLRHGTIEWRLSLPPDFASYGESVDLTVYRTVQECLTNAARHAGASVISVSVTLVAVQNRMDKEAAIHIRVVDDGRGIDPDTEFGFGLSGVKQRAEALGGAISMERCNSGGTLVSITIPVAALPGQPAGLAERLDT